MEASQRDGGIDLGSVRAFNPHHDLTLATEVQGGDIDAMLAFNPEYGVRTPGQPWGPFSGAEGGCGCAACSPVSSATLEVRSLKRPTRAIDNPWDFSQAGSLSRYSPPDSPLISPSIEDHELACTWQACMSLWADMEDHAKNASEFEGRVREECARDPTGEDCTTAYLAWWQESMAAANAQATWSITCPTILNLGNIPDICKLPRNV